MDCSLCTSVHFSTIRPMGNSCDGFYDWPSFHRSVGFAGHDLFSNDVWKVPNRLRRNFRSLLTHRGRNILSRVCVSFRKKHFPKIPFRLAMGCNSIGRSLHRRSYTDIPTLLFCRSNFYARFLFNRRKAIKCFFRWYRFGYSSPFDAIHIARRHRSQYFSGQYFNASICPDPLFSYSFLGLEKKRNSPNRTINNRETNEIIIFYD